VSYSATKPLRDKPLGEGTFFMGSLAHRSSSLHWDLYSLDTFCDGQAV